MKYDGKMVEVRGIDESWSEGWALSDANCPTHIVEKGLDFANAINLSLYLEITSPHWDSAAYIPDRDQIDKVDREVGHLRRMHPHDNIAVTYRGLFESRPILVSTNLAGGLTRAGFGHLGGCPGQLVIQTAKDPRVMHHQKFKRTH
ncbi:MAG TPA: hypothetical protein VJN43_06695 [Bryobacteraceae bacterium]|nr:hypothetical protein [Bryobacteraceae bacterium]